MTPHELGLKFGKREARMDLRIPRMQDRIDLSALPPLVNFSNWYADQATTGVPMLGNNKYGCCVQASIAHFIGAISRYVTPMSALVPTEAEVLKMYSDMTGFNPNDPSTDNGTYFMGPGSAIQQWWQRGVVVGGKLNRPAAVAHVDYTDHTMLRQAISLMGFVFVGANLRQADIESNFMWRPSPGSVIGGHEFLLVGYVIVSGQLFYDILTWNGMWRCTSEWIDQSVDEAAIVFNKAFFDVRLINPAGISWAMLANDMRILGHA